MARFKGNAEKPGPISKDAPVAEGSLSIIAKGMEIVGDLNTQGVVKIEGEVRGTIRANKQVLVSAGGVVDGDIVTKEAIVGGEVKGSITAEDRVEIQSPSVVNGDITTKRIVIAEGGEVNGAIHMGEQHASVSRIETPIKRAEAS